MKDNFSSQSDAYARFRPGYPDALFDWIFTQLKSKNSAWDCGTGNGQVAVKLSEVFDKVIAMDLSAQQIKKAPRKSNIRYAVLPAEKAKFPKDHFDLITVAQAIHWFDFEAFYNMVRHSLKKEGLLVVMGYGLLEIDQAVDEIIRDFYKNKIGPFWDAERQYIDQMYQTIPFPFEEILTPKFTNSYDWTLAQLTGYINTWSAVQHFQKAKGFNPVDQLEKDLKDVWKSGEVKSVNFPVLLRMGKI